MWKVDPWALCLFAILVLSCGGSAKRLFDPGLVHWDHVCGGAPHPCCAHGLLCAEKQRWQVCRYAAAAAPATGHVLHGKRSVSLWPGLGPLAVSLQDVNQNSSHEMYSTYRRRQSVKQINYLFFHQFFRILFWLLIWFWSTSWKNENVQWASILTPTPVWKCIMSASGTLMHANPAQNH